MACEETIERWHNSRNESSHLSDDAVRSMVKTKWQKRLMKKLAQGRAELSILKGLSHPNIIGAERILMSDHTVYLFQELITGGDLWSYLDTNGDPGLEDADITVVTKQLLEAVAYLHDQGIVHRDVKPENILMSSWKAGGRIVLTDFGLAKHICDSTAATSTQVRRKRMHTTVGTFEYAAPEVRLQDKSEESENGYTCAVDLWSVGAIAVLLFTAKSVSDLFPIDEVDEINMTSQEISQSGGDICGIAADTEGHLPFMATCSQRDPISRTSQQQMVSVNNLRTTGGTLICDLSDLDDAQHETWGRIASRPKDFIKRLLVLDEAKRMTAHQALAHSWLTKKYYKHVLDGVYENAVKDWKPKGVIDIERIETDVSRLGPLEDDTVLLNLLQESTSRHFR
ncbi:hypothetical protein B9Z65_6200 [Elsinoe australis]|uniref:Protein kinase domain-containing protein n=1 Tax=Elsinoe australis TaxID=40998 RepID=A0A2P8A7Z2_9PEZI|nr:hypothetical protein B9Z65_6200 [Elsinoe australis]